MKKILVFLTLVCLAKNLHAQQPYIYTIKADSVKITNTCDTAELIIENHTQNVPGFLFNKGKGRTEFRRVMSKLDDSIYVIGIDTLRLSVAWLQGGNRFGATGKFGTLDNNHIDFYTNNTKRGRWTNTGNLLVGTESADNNYKLAVGGTTYSQFFTNSTTPLGAGGSGALRLRWGGGEGTYFDFYYQGNTNRRGIMGTASDSRPLYIFDSVGFSFLSTPYVTLGLETGASISSRFTIASTRTSGWDAFTILGTDAQYNRDFTVKANGNTILGGYGADNGNKLQVNGAGWFGNNVYVSHPTYATGGVGAGMKWVDNNSFIIYGGPSERITFGPSNSITSSSGFFAPSFWSSNPVGSFDANYHIPTSGGVYSTTGFPGNSDITYHKFTIKAPGSNTGTGRQTLMELNKLVNRGNQDGLETGLRILFNVTGTANNLRALETVNGDVRLHTNSGRTSIGLDESSTITSRLDVSGEQGYNQLRLRKKYTPTSSSDTNGAEGDVSWDDNYFYIKTSSGWKRSALTTF
jgi:hypothetical protein